MVRKKSAPGAVAAACITAMVLVGAAPAHATEDPIQATADLVAQLAPDQGQVVETSAVDGEVTAVTGNSAAVVPLAPDSPITLGARGDVEARSDQLVVALPPELDVSHGQVTDGGTIVFPATDGDASAAVQVLDDDAVRIQTVIPDSEATHEFTYEFDGLTPVLRDDGGADLLAKAGEGAVMVAGTVAAPWAIDSSGEPVATAYELIDGKLTQVITPDEDTVYPVIADPKVTTTWWNTTIYFNRNETAIIAGGAGGAAAVAAYIPDPTISKAVAVALGLATAYVGTIHATGKCVKIVYYAHIANVPQPYGGSEAGGYCR